jgi:membrane protein YdbS with pleckstrin-like domain
MERFYRSAKPAWVSIILGFFGASVLIWFVGNFVNAGQLALLAVAALFVLGAILLWVARWHARTTSYELGERELVVRSGVLSKSERAFPFRMVNNVAVGQGPFEMLLGLKNLYLDVSGEQGYELRATRLEAREVDYIAAKIRSKL